MQNSGFNAGELNYGMNWWLSDLNCQDYQQSWIAQRLWDPAFLSSLPSVPGDSPWPAEPTNKNFRTRFRRQLRHILGLDISLPHDIKQLLRGVWPVVPTDGRDDYEEPKLYYNAARESLSSASSHAPRLDSRARVPAPPIQQRSTESNGSTELDNSDDAQTSVISLTNAHLRG